jgi:hypothetical protein
MLSEVAEAKDGMFSAADRAKLVQLFQTDAIKTQHLTCQLVA